jgi:hypothetical protein
MKFMIIKKDSLQISLQILRVSVDPETGDLTYVSRHFSLRNLYTILISLDGKGHHHPKSAED